MFIQAITPGQVASAVWGVVTRTLTGFGASSIVVLSGIPGAAPAATTVSCRPPAGQWWLITVTVIAGAAGSTELQVFKTASVGVTVLTVAAGQMGGFTFMAERDAYPQVKNNDAINAASIICSGFALVA